MASVSDSNLWVLVFLAVTLVWRLSQTPDATAADNYAQPRPPDASSTSTSTSTEDELLELLAVRNETVLKLRAALRILDSLGDRANDFR